MIALTVFFAVALTAMYVAYEGRMRNLEETVTALIEGKVA